MDNNPIVFNDPNGDCICGLLFALNGAAAALTSTAAMAVYGGVAAGSLSSMHSQNANMNNGDGKGKKKGAPRPKFEEGGGFSSKSRYNLKLKGKIEHNMSGYIAQGGFVTDRYMSNLAEKATRHDWAKRLYERIDARTKWSFSASESHTDLNFRRIPENGKVTGADFTLEDDTDGTTDLLVTHEGRGVLWGNNLPAGRRLLTNPKAGSVIRVQSFLHVEYQLNRAGDNFMRPLMESIEKAAPSFNVLPGITLSFPATKFKYSMHVNYKIR